MSDEWGGVYITWDDRLCNLYKMSEEGYYLHETIGKASMLLMLACAFLLMISFIIGMKKFKDWLSCPHV